MKYSIQRNRRRTGLARIVREPQARLGLVLLAFVLAIALFGPWLAPHSSEALLGEPFGSPSTQALLGYDYLGRDVVSRVLDGGRSILWMSLAVTGIALLTGMIIGLFAGYKGGWVDQFTVWCTDVLLAFPDLLFVLMVVSLFGHAPWIVVLVVALCFVSGTVRLVRGVTLGVAEQEYVEAARLIGFSTFRIIRGEILPNIATPLLVHSGLMLTGAVAMLSGLNFLGYGVSAPVADWGLMVNENRGGLLFHPYSVLVPVILIACFALGANLLAEGIGRAATRAERVH